MDVLKEIERIKWEDYETAYGNADLKGDYTDVATNFTVLFGDDKVCAINATHYLWCGLCHQHSYVSSAALPAYDILLHGLHILEDELKVEILDIMLGFTVCTMGERASEEWQKELRECLKRDITYFKGLMDHANEDISSFAEGIYEKLIVKA